MPPCSIKQCGARKNKNQPNLTLHRFPVNKTLKKKWIEAIGFDNINPKHKMWHICSLHFDETCFNRTLDVIRLRDGAVPTSTMLDPLQIHANASGDGDGVPGRCCRLCGGDNNLRYFGDTYIWEGVEERYDHLLNDCFGVKVTPPDCLICECCVRALRTTQRFRALVHAAFDNPGSDLSSSLGTLKSSTCVKKVVKLSTKSEKDELHKKPFELVKRREVRKRTLGGVGGDAKAKRTNIPCDICKQRIPQQPRKVSTYEVTKPRSQKYQCSQCPKKYELARHLAQHVRNAQEDSLDNVCTVCNQNMATHKKLQEHLLEHSGLHQCDECLLIFKSKKSLAAHSTKHHDESTIPPAD